MNTERAQTDGNNYTVHQATHVNGESSDGVFDRNRRRLYVTALRVMGNHDDAEDALRDGLMAAFRKLNTFEGHSQFSTWLTRIVVNAALMKRRQRPVRQLLSSQIS